MDSLGGKEVPAEVVSAMSASLESLLAVEGIELEDLGIESYADGVEGCEWNTVSAERLRDKLANAFDLFYGILIRDNKWVKDPGYCVTSLRQTQKQYG